MVGTISMASPVPGLNIYRVYCTDCGQGTVLSSFLFFYSL
jgi:hypothetical protein